MSSSEKDITELSEEHKLFILEEKDLFPKFGRHRIQVGMGTRWLIYKDGLLVDQKNPGPDSWWNGFLHKWKAQVINTRVELLHIGVKGRVKGPQIPREAPGATAVDLACEVTAELELSCKLVDVENFLQYRDPLSVFLASVRNMVIEFIGRLPYDQYGQWATVLRDAVRDRLQGGRDDAERRIGMKVEDVFVTEFKPNTTNDRNMLAMYQMVERARRELVEAQANAQRDSVVASSFADQGQILNIAPSILALQNSPIGKALIDRDADLRKLMVASGLNPGVNVQPLQDPTGQLGSGLPTSAGYLNPPRPSVPEQLQPGQVSGQLYTTGSLNPTSAQPSSQFPSDMGSPPVDDARQRAEISALEQAGFSVAGRGQVVPIYDDTGRPLPDSKEWVLQVSMRRPVGHLMIVFHCPAGYPAFAPSVQVRPPTGGGLIWIEPNTVNTWHVGHMLVEAAREINDDTP